MSKFNKCPSYLRFDDSSLWYTRTPPRSRSPRSRVDELHEDSFSVLCCEHGLLIRHCEQRTALQAQRVVEEIQSDALRVQPPGQMPLPYLGLNVQRLFIEILPQILHCDTIALDHRPAMLLRQLQRFLVDVGLPV